MAHEIYINHAGKASMAYVGDTPWHGLGQTLTPDSPLEVWAKEAGMDFEINSATALYQPSPDIVYQMPNKVVLFRSDNHAPLGMVSPMYQVVQPRDVLEFFRDLTTRAGMQLETAGVLFGGAKYWALAKTNNSLALGKDRIDSYLLLSTACDGSMQTTGLHTAIRAVCNNTVSAALAGAKTAVKLSHRNSWSPDNIKQMKMDLGIDVAWLEFSNNVHQLANMKVSDYGAAHFIATLMGNPMNNVVDQVCYDKSMATVYQLFKGKGRGADMESAKGTAWGLLNGVTEYSDYFAGRSDERRFVNSVLTTDSLKTQAMQMLLKMEPEELLIEA